MTQKSEAQKGNITPEMEVVAHDENINVNKLAKLIADGKVVIPKNINGHSKACGIGDGLKTKINANIGSSSKIDDIELEINKAKLAQEYGADALMDLSTGSDLTTFRKKIMDAVDITIGTVPIYEAGVITLNKNKEIIDMDPDDLFKAIENQAKEGVDFMTLHCGITKDLVEKLEKAKRMMLELINKNELKEIVNTSIKETMARSISTSLTTLLPVIALLIMGSREILTFNVALIVGIIAGTYSSLLIAGWLYVLFASKRKNDKRRKTTKEISEKTIKGINA